jgi:AraC family transcriptional regulator
LDIRKFHVTIAPPTPDRRSLESPITRTIGRIVLELFPTAPYSAKDPSHIQSLGIALERQQGVHAIGSDKRVDFDTWPGVLAYTPPGIDVFSESALGGEYLVARWAGADVLPTRQRVEMPGNRGAMAIGRRIRHELLSSSSEPLALEQLTLQFVGLRRHMPMVGTFPHRSLFGPVLERIADEYARPLTLSDLAQSVNQTPLQFLRDFTRAVGMTPHAFITETRLRASRQMLAHSDTPIALIALQCGFSHQSHMGTAFRRILGMTPSEYRRVHR